MLAVWANQCYVPTRFVTVDTSNMADGKDLQTEPNGTTVNLICEQHRGTGRGTLLSLRFLGLGLMRANRNVNKSSCQKTDELKFSTG